MILTLSGTWIIDPRGPLRRSKQGEDLWSYINAIGSIMSGTALSPWFIGESNDEQLHYNGVPEDVMLEFYASEGADSSALDFLPAIMFATDIALQQGFSSFDLRSVRVDRHPGERPGAPTDSWWNNYFNHSHDDAQQVLEISPELPGFEHAAQSECPNLFSCDGSTLLAQSWGLNECAVLISLLSSIQPDWASITIESRPMAED